MDLSVLYRESEKKWHAGDKIGAIQMVVTEFNSLQPDQRSAKIFELLAYYLYHSQNYSAALTTLEEAQKHHPNVMEILDAAFTTVLQLKDFEKAEQYLKKIESVGKAPINVLDGAASLYAKTGNYRLARKYGRAVLRRKDKEFSKGREVFPVPQSAKKYLQDREERQVNYIAFTLFGDGRQYLRGALQNVIEAKHLLPNWVPIFYVDETVPREILGELQDLGAKLEFGDAAEIEPKKLLWRFNVWCRNDCARFLCRDADSVICKREVDMVDAWIQSDRAFSVTRDWWTHTELILAGLWGGVGGVLPTVEQLHILYNTKDLPNMHLDQHILRSVVWPTIKQSLKTFDTCYSYLDKSPAADFTKLQVENHIGGNAAILMPDKQAARLARYKHLSSLGLEVGEPPVPEKQAS